LLRHIRHFFFATLSLPPLFARHAFAELNMPPDAMLLYAITPHATHITQQRAMLPYAISISTFAFFIPPLSSSPRH